MKISFFYFAILTLFAGLYSCKQAKGKINPKNHLAIIDSNSVRLQLVTDGVAAPIQLMADPDTTNRMFIADNQGKIWIMKNDSLLVRPFLDISVTEAVKKKSPKLGTINSIAFHPQFATNHKFFVCYNAATSIAANKTKLVVAEFTGSNKDVDTADAKTERLVFELEGKQMFSNGAEIAFGPDGYLYISIGDDALGDSTYQYHGQDLNYFNGKLLRIDVNKIPYGIPPDNPFVGMKNKKPEIWAYGFRKVWRFSFDQKTNQLFGADVGESKQEEIDIITKGANYGWPVMEGNSVFTKNNAADKKSFITPINAYSHKDGICVIGGSFYYGNDVPFFKGKYIFGDFNGKLFTLTNNANGQWTKQVVNVTNNSADPFLVCGLNTDKNNELFVMGFLNEKAGPKGVVYKIIKN